MINEPIAELFGDLALELFQLFIDKFDDLAGLDIDQVIMMFIGSRFIPRTAIAKIMALKNTGFLEQADCPVNRGDRDPTVHSRGPFMQGLNVGMIVCFRQDASNHPALFGDAQTFLGTQGFNVDFAMHGFGLEKFDAAEKRNATRL